MKIRFLCLVFAVILLLSGCVVIGENVSVEGLFGVKQGREKHPEISGILELRDFVTQQREEGYTKFSFCYTGLEELDPGLVAKMADVCYVKMIQENNIYHLELSLFPGERIVEAYNTENLTTLSADEKKVLEIATDMVTTAKEHAHDDWELELLLHDMLCRRITYSDADIYYDTPENQPRHLSVIGALLDGQANCQGYTDAFYTLASLAGFEVGRLSVETDAAPHMVNIILLAGSWYVVDLTYDDSSDDVISYRLFNVGLDMIGEEYSWSEKVEFNAVTAKSDENNYYIRNDIVFEDIDHLAEYIAKTWEENGNIQIDAMVKDESESEKLSKILPDVLKKIGRSYSYNIWHSSNGKDSFYTVIFD